MTSIAIDVQHRRLEEVLRKGPEILQRHMNLAILRTVQTMARQAKRNAPQGQGTLVQSIQHQMDEQEMEGQVLVGAEYGRMVEEGTGPGGFPAEQDIVDWLRVKNIQPNKPGMPLDKLAHAIVRSIALKGTPPQPYLEPAAESEKARAERRIKRAISDALREMGA